jgi:hypothetical protein
LGRIEAREKLGRAKGGKRVTLSGVPNYGVDDAGNDRSGSGAASSIEYNYTILEDNVSKHCVVYQSPTGGRTTGSASCLKR